MTEEKLDAARRLLTSGTSPREVADWGQYEDWLPLNIEGMYGYLK